MLASCRAAIAHHPDLTLYDFGPQHPLRPERITAGLQLLEAAALWSRDDEIIGISESSIVDLETVHSRDYIGAVDHAGSGLLPASYLTRFGLSTRDNPAFPGMHQAASLVAGATVGAAHRVLTSHLDHAFSPAGGLHHALRDRASGFCVYNDAAIAAAVMVREYDCRVFYVDFDCHHGDGVQWLFYPDPRVMTVSLHESGRFLFPGTGNIDEIGEGPGTGYCVNLPFAPFTRDADWINAVHSLLPPLIERFRPDVIISNHGCDTHVWDPLTHLALSTVAFAAQARLVHELSHAYCNGRWVAVGSGGYDWVRVVPRSWSIVWGEMTGRALPPTMPGDWRERWSNEADGVIPEQFLDGEDVAAAAPAHEDILRSNRTMLKAVLDMAVRRS